MTYMLTLSLCDFKLNGTSKSSQCGLDDLVE